jgi:hypothetical protein
MTPTIGTSRFGRLCAVAVGLAVVATATVAAQQPEPAKPTTTPMPNKSSSIRGFALTTEQRADLVAFLQALTDEALLRDPRFGNPWVRRPDR